MKYFLSLGSNVGNRIENVSEALKLLKRDGIEITKKSSVYETSPWGVENQQDFMNMCVRVKTHLKPERLLLILKRIEKEMGRINKERYARRVIDIDILLSEEIELKSKNLTIPHKWIKERAFVLVPLLEINPAIKVDGIFLKKHLGKLKEQNKDGKIKKVLSKELVSRI